MPRKTSKASGNGSFSRLPNSKPSPSGNDLPSFDDARGFGACVDLLMRHGVYVGFQRGNDGSVIGITVLNGADKKRAWCHSQSELLDALIALAEEFGDAEPVRLLSAQDVG